MTCRLPDSTENVLRKNAAYLIRIYTIGGHTYLGPAAAHYFSHKYA